MDGVKNERSTFWFPVLGWCLAFVVLVSIVLMRKGTPSTLNQANDLKATQAPAESFLYSDQGYIDLFKKMDKEKNKIAKALKEYRDPNTSFTRKTNLGNFIRHTDIKTAEDKLLLKHVMRDPQYRELRDDIQMGILHSIQRKPEESDKEFILELLRDGDNNVGWLYYAMLDVWDDRYVPFLLEGAKQGALSDIKILGRRHVKEAVPFLEELLKTGNPYLEENVRIALRQIRENN